MSSTIKTYVHHTTVTNETREEAASAKQHANQGSSAKKARKSTGKTKENKPDFLRYLSEKLAFEEYLLEPISDDSTFFVSIQNAIDRGGHNVPIVQLFNEKLKPSKLAEALVVKYDDGQLFFTPKALKLKLSNQTGENLWEDRDFCRKFLIGNCKEVSIKPKKDRKTKKLTGYEHVYKFELDKASLFKRLNDDHINDDLSYFQNAALKFNPYFTLEEERTVAQEQAGNDGKFTFKFKSPFNETKGRKSVAVTEVAQYFKDFVTGLPNDVDKKGNEKPKDLSRFGDTLFVFKNSVIQKALYLNYPQLTAPDSADVSFNDDEIDRFNMSPPSFVSLKGDYSSSSGIGGMLTETEGGVVKLIVKNEDRYFERPKGTELRSGCLMVLGRVLYDSNNALNEYVDNAVIAAGIAWTDDLSGETRMKHGMQLEGVDDWEENNYM